MAESSIVHQPEAKQVVPLRHPLRWVAALVVVLLVAALGYSLVTNPRFQWDVVGQYLTTRAILDGLLTTLELTAIGMVIAITLGTIIALMRLSPNPILSVGSGVYVWFFRGTPLLVQLILLYNISALYPTISIGIPFGPQLINGSANAIITPFVAAILGLGLNEAAYMSEIVRAGILSVDRGQTEAAQALGLRRRQIMRWIVLPQALRVIIPPASNETISMLKYTSLVSVISLPELLYSAQIIYSRTFQTIPLLLVASIWYLVVTSVLTVGQFFIERRFARGTRGQAPSGLGQWLLKNVVRTHQPPPLSRV